MSVLHAQPPVAPLERKSVPPLENGDRLDRVEFERRYSAMPEVKKAELIGGIVYMPSPVRHAHHGRPQFFAAGWLSYYVAHTPGVDPSDNATLRLDDENEPQPDLLLRLPESAGGRSRISDDDYLEGSAELVIEIAASSVSLDLHAKRDAYRRHGVREYLVWRVRDAAIDWFALRGDTFEPTKPDERGLLKSEVFAGLWLDPAALLRGDLPRLLQVLEEGMRTPEHAALVARLGGQ
jgi:hypothetical protein